MFICHDVINATAESLNSLQSWINIIALAFQPLYGAGKGHRRCLRLVLISWAPAVFADVYRQASL